MVINYSGGGYTPNSYTLDAVIYANTYGVTIVAAAGNENSSIIYPAIYSSSYDNVIAVGATNHNDAKSPYSNYGTQLNVVAPGGHGFPFDADDIFSTTPNYPFFLEYYGVTRNYGYLAGTSMATPHVAGTAALLLSINPDLTPQQIRTIIEASAEDRGVTGWDEQYGHGRVNAYKALRYTFTNYGGQIISKVKNGWNITSIPLRLLNYLKPVVYPTATSPAWQLVGTNYVAKDTLSNGVGYWIKFGIEYQK